MICKNCGANLHDTYTRCPYCNTDTGVPPQSYGVGMPPQNGYPQNNFQQNYPQNGYPPQYDQIDQVNAGLVILSILIPLAGLIVGIMNISNGKKRSGKVYLITAIAT